MSEPDASESNSTSMEKTFRVLNGSTAKDRLSKKIYELIREKRMEGYTLKELVAATQLNYYTVRDHVRRLEMLQLVKPKNEFVHRDRKYVVKTLDGEDIIPFIPDFLKPDNLAYLNKYWNASLELIDGTAPAKLLPENISYLMMNGICHLWWAAECASNHLTEIDRNIPLARDWRRQALESQRLGFELIMKAKKLAEAIIISANVLLEDEMLHTDKMRELYDMFILVPAKYQLKREHDTEWMINDWRNIKEFYANYREYEMQARRTPEPELDTKFNFVYPDEEPELSKESEPDQIRTEQPTSPSQSPIHFDPNL